eukprot:353649-Hanusia_phi.AAC.1
MEEEDRRQEQGGGMVVVLWRRRCMTITIHLVLVDLISLQHSLACMEMREQEETARVRVREKA